MNITILKNSKIVYANKERNNSLELIPLHSNNNLI